MAEKQQSAGGHTEVFRQFAWYLAGTIAASRGAAKPVKTGGKR